MKTYLTTALLLISSLAFSDDGTTYNSRCYIHDMDINLDLFYTSVDGYLNVANKKGKEEKYEITSNISIYDIKTGKTSYLFADTLKEKIVEFYFESHYDSLMKQMVFNQSSDNEDQSDIIVGNHNLKSRAASDKLFVLTYSYVTDKYTLWTAHKTGADLKRIYVFELGTDYYFDVKNKALRFVRQVGKKIETTDVSY